MDQILLVLLVILFVIVIWYFTAYNRFKRLQLQIDAAYANIDVALSKRHDTLVNLVEVVKGYAKHERETIRSVTEVRSNSLQELSKSDEQLSVDQSRLYAYAEAYPELKADQNFLHLQKVIADAEEHLQAARRLYNQSVKAFNTALEVFPSNLIGQGMKLTPATFYQAGNEAKEEMRITL